MVFVSGTAVIAPTGMTIPKGIAGVQTVEVFARAPLQPCVPELAALSTTDPGYF